MENNLQIFKNAEFGEVRTIEENGQIYFCGNDVAKALGYAIPRKAITDHCKEDGVLKRNGVVLTTNQYGTTTEQVVEMKFINEGNLYRLIVNSKLESAEKFEKWVFDEVLPTIRKHGAYMTPDTIEKLMTDPDSWIKLITAFKDEREQKEQLQLEAKQNEPKIIFANSVATSDDTILIRELAKILKGNGINVGEKRLFEQLREDGFLIKARNDDYNTPTQRAMELGLFKLKETTIQHADGNVYTRRTPKVTGKGQLYFVNYFTDKSKGA